MTKLVILNIIKFPKELKECNSLVNNFMLMYSNSCLLDSTSVNYKTYHNFYIALTGSTSAFCSTRGPEKVSVLKLFYCKGEFPHAEK